MADMARAPSTLKPEAIEPFQAIYAAPHGAGRSSVHAIARVARARLTEASRKVALAASDIKRRVLSEWVNKNLTQDGRAPHACCPSPAARRSKA